MAEDQANRYAVNLPDLLELSRHDPIFHMLVAQHIDREDVVEAERGKAVGIGTACVLACPEAQAKAIVQLARRKYRKYQLRFYVNAIGRAKWKRV